MTLDKNATSVIEKLFIGQSINIKVTLVLLLTSFCLPIRGSIVFPRGSSYGYLAALAMPLNLPKHDIFMAFNFEANYGLPFNDSNHQWIDKFTFENENLDIDNNLTHINGRVFNRRQRQAYSPRYDRLTFYRLLVGYLNYYDYNGTACLLRSICEVAAYDWEENNGVFGSILKILFMPSSSAREYLMPHQHAIGLNNQEALYRAELSGNNHQQNAFDIFKSSTPNYYAHYSSKRNINNKNIDICVESVHQCPESPIDMIARWY